MPIQVTGAGLLSLLADNPDATRSQIATLAGYRRDSQRINWTSFYTALLEAKQLNKQSEPAEIPRQCGDGPAIYVACLASYNAGTLYGSWLDLSDGPGRDEISEAIEQILAESPTEGAEEYAIHDSQGLPAFLSGSEWPDLDALADYCEVWASLPESSREPYRILCGDNGGVISEDQFRERFCGIYNDPEDYAYELWTECGDMPSHLEPYIDWERVWRDMSIDGYSSTYSSEAGGYIITRDY